MISQLEGRTKEDKETDPGIAYFHFSRASSQPGAGDFYTAFIDYLSSSPSTQIARPTLNRLPDDPSSFTTFVDASKARIYSFDNKAKVYIGVPREGLHEVIAIQGTFVPRACAVGEMRMLTSVIGSIRGWGLTSLQNLGVEEAQKYFRIETGQTI